jgi:cyclopropane-fatty-acyl-phospholipid synthase
MLSQSNVAQPVRKTSPNYAGLGRTGRRSLRVLELLFGDAFCRDFDVELWDGTRVPSHSGERRFSLAVREPFALRAAFSPPFDLSPGRAFALGWLEVDGDVEAAVDRLFPAIARVRGMRAAALMGHIALLPAPPHVDDVDVSAALSGRPHSPKRDRSAVGFHYDQGTEFFRAFLDDDLVYSCAYFDDGIETLEDAQRAKIDYILRKVRLHQGHRLLDVGCGWGALVLRAAEAYGARATGITLSRAQYEEAKRRIAQRGLGDRCSVELCDYRELGQRRFDRIVSVGMVEHVGQTHLRAYFAALWKALAPGGLMLNHGIAEQSEGRRGGKATGFVARYVFPDGELVSLGVRLPLAEQAGFEVRDVENLREHYARTLRAWLKRLESKREAVIALTDEQTYRIWRLYLAGSAQGFASGRMGLFQTLLAKPDGNPLDAIPATRRNLYAVASGHMTSLKETSATAPR